ncbi:MAG: hypothetical protein MMC33_004833 [Icmadophila ericetorum]|nr:hypothetical protein [Icmadophila ericetorum]
MSGCTICNEPNAQVCGGCQSSKYCSSECQRVDWSVHKLLCREYKSHTDRPGSTYKRAIVFYADKQVPQLVWCPTKEQVDQAYSFEEDDGEEPLKWELALNGGFFGSKKNELRCSIAQRNALRDRILDHNLEIWYGDNHLNDDTPTNQAIVAATKGKMKHHWKGTVMVMRKRDLEQHPSFYGDITMIDFRDVVDWLSDYGNQNYMTGVEKDTGKYSKKVKGVLLNCQGDLMLKSGQFSRCFEPIEVPTEHPVFSTPMAPISKCVGHALRARKLLPNSSWKHDRASYDNRKATFLYLCADEQDDVWGWAPPEWQSYVGSVLVVRDDKKDLTPEQLEVMCDFCDTKMANMFESALEGGMSRQKVMAALTKKSFEEWSIKKHQLRWP